MPKMLPIGSITLLGFLGVALSASAQEQKPEEVLSAVVGVQAKIQADAKSAATLGQRRQGSGALIREGWC